MQIYLCIKQICFNFYGRVVNCSSLILSVTLQFGYYLVYYLYFIYYYLFNLPKTDDVKGTRILCKCSTFQVLGTV